MRLQVTMESNSPRRASFIAFKVASAVLVAVCVLAVPMGAKGALLAGSQPASGELAPGRVIERPLAGGQSHTYPISLSAGQYAGLLVEQKGLSPLRVSLAGYGQYRPRANNESSQDRRFNRRVDIVILNAAATQADDMVQP